MKNYITIDGHQVELTGELVDQIKALFSKQDTTLLDLDAGDTFKVGEHELIVLEHFEDGTTAIIVKDLLPDTEFGKTNNYNGSYVDEKCQAFAQELADVIGWDNIVLHKVDLTSDDGLKDYGQVERRASLLTANLYRRYVEILDKHPVKKWWWLATAFSTPRHDQDNWVKCVSPSGYFSDVNYYYYFGVRPFCILESTIFVSK